MTGKSGNKKFNLLTHEVLSEKQLNKISYIRNKLQPKNDLDE